MFVFIKKVFLERVTVLSGFRSANSLSCISMSQELMKQET